MGKHREAGLYLEGLRLEKGMGQRELAEKLNLELYTEVAAREAGAGMLGPSEILDWADALEVDRTEFSREMLSFYYPDLSEALFPNDKD